ncbi:MAG TPA: hypothetical protein PKD52_08010 [Clostridiales bacterium]|nr:hypothetical protein [Clostridiales bacterium]
MHYKYIYYIYPNTPAFSGIIHALPYGDSWLLAETAYFYAYPCFTLRKKGRKNAERLGCSPFGAVWCILLKKRTYYFATTPLFAVSRQSEEAIVKP